MVLGVEQLITMEQAAERCGVSLATMRKWRQRGIGPLSFRVGGQVRYDASELSAWLQDQREAGLREQAARAAAS